MKPDKETATAIFNAAMESCEDYDCAGGEMECCDCGHTYETVLPALKADQERRGVVEVPRAWLEDREFDKRYCPACHVDEGESHEPNCWLGRALGREECL